MSFFKYPHLFLDLFISRIKSLFYFLYKLPGKLTKAIPKANSFIYSKYNKIKYILLLGIVIFFSYKIIIKLLDSTYYIKVEIMPDAFEDLGIQTNDWASHLEREINNIKSYDKLSQAPEGVEVNVDAHTEFELQIAGFSFQSSINAIAELFSKKKLIIASLKLDTAQHKIYSQINIENDIFELEQDYSTSIIAALNTLRFKTAYQILKLTTPVVLPIFNYEMDNKIQAVKEIDNLLPNIKKNIKLTKDLLYLKALCFFTEGRLDEIRELYNQNKQNVDKSFLTSLLSLYLQTAENKNDSETIRSIEHDFNSIKTENLNISNLLLGNIYYVFKKYLQAANQYYLTINNNEDDSTLAMGNLAMIFTERNMYDSAEFYFNKFYKKPINQVKLTSLILLGSWTNDQEFKTKLNKCIKNAPKYKYLPLAKAIYYQYYSKPILIDSAVTFYRQFFEKDSSLTIANINYGNCLRYQHKYIEALNKINKEIKKSPINIEFYNSLMDVYLDVENELKIKEISTMFTNETKYFYNVSFISKHARSLQNQGKYQEALDKYSFAYAINPTDFYTINNFGNCLINMADYDKAISVFSAGIEVYPNEQDFYFALIECYKHLNSPFLAAQVGKHIVEVDSSSKSKVLYEIGLSYKIVGVLDSALMYFENSYNCDSFNYNSLNELKDYALMSGYYNLAIKYADKMKIIPRTEKIIYKVYADIYYLKGDLSIAYNYYVKYLFSNAMDCEALLKLRECIISSGKMLSEDKYYNYFLTYSNCNFSDEPIISGKAIPGFFKNLPDSKLFNQIVNGIQTFFKNKRIQTLLTELEQPKYNFDTTQGEHCLFVNTLQENIDFWLLGPGIQRKKFTISANEAISTYIEPNTTIFRIYTRDSYLDYLLIRRKRYNIYWNESIKKYDLKPF